MQSPEPLYPGTQVPLEYRLLGYEEEAFPGLTPYTPPLPDQPLMPGAHEEAPPSACTPSGGWCSAASAGRLDQIRMCSVGCASMGLDGGNPEHWGW